MHEGRRIALEQEALTKKETSTTLIRAGVLRPARKIIPIARAAKLRGPIAPLAGIFGKITCD
jgi:hypothetical protein